MYLQTVARDRNKVGLGRDSRITRNMQSFIFSGKKTQKTRYSDLFTFGLPQDAKCFLPPDLISHYYFWFIINDIN